MLRAYLGNGNAANDLAELATKRFGGATILNGMGRYTDTPGGTIHHEIAWIVEVITQDTGYPSDFLNMVQTVLDNSSEDEILTVWSDGIYRTLKKCKTHKHWLYES
jgi:hypothetical protein